MSSPAPVRPRTVGLQTLLVALTALAVLPVIGFAVMLLQVLWSGGQDEARRELQQTVASLATALDREIAGSIRELQRIAEYPTLDDDRLDEFHGYVHRLVERNDRWKNVTVTDHAGNVLVNAVRRLDAPLESARLPYVDAALRTGQPQLSDVYESPLSGGRAISVAVPVTRPGGARWVLTARLDPAVLSNLLTGRLQREGSLASVLDRDGVLVARSREAHRYFAHRATPDLRDAIAESPQRGAARLVTLDGQAVLAAWERLPSGWTTTVGVSVEAYDPALRRSIATLVAFGALVLAAGGIVSLALARRISIAIESAEADARALAAGEPFAERRSRIAQVAALFSSLAEAGRRQREHASARELALDALRRSERRLQTALVATGAGTFDWDPRTDSGDWSARARELLGLPAEGPVDVAAFYRVVHPEDRARVRAAVVAGLGGADEGRVRIEFRVVAPDGEVRHLDGGAHVDFDGDGRARRPIRLVGVVIDQTERQRRVEALHEADRRKDEFIAMLSHELRNPLAPIRTAVALLGRILPREGPPREALRMAERQVAHVTRLVDDLLDVSRITQGKIELRRRPVALSEAVRQALETIRPAIERRGQRLTLEMAEPPPVVVGDPLRLAQVIENLLSNASKYTDPGGSISLELSAGPEEAVIRVRDTGIGLAPEQLSRVFELFAQVDATLDRAQGGLGIGLSLVRRLVEMHGGTVTASSDGPGLGSCFELRLPRVLAEPER